MTTLIKDLSDENQDITNVVSTDLRSVDDAQLALSSYIAYVNSIPILDIQEESRLAMDYFENKNKIAANIIIKAHLRLVVKIAYQFSGYKMSIMELISEGNYGLIKAMEKFDPRRGFRFATYAIWWIRAKIQEYIMNSFSMVKNGGIAAYKRMFFNQGEVKKSDQILQLNGQILNDVPLDDISSDYIASKDDIVLDCDKEIKIDKIKKIINEKLNSREKEIVYYRIISDNLLTLDEISKKFSISKERVRQIYENAIVKIQSAII
ncbi:sigma-70 family RNA polymerase sigma factor [Candidatus Deianiraea vastatrix]|uniref:Sigma-32 factor RpoH n=1 Tax=Candidatus Deianiraea vastatrix TaxID=2163644 RepID=A0A5B8XCU9_9RICK|nr:sigma-70 family RNA polymerase sigma factor [Candidatus Deianiraea vastatrix]QED23142.1 sigma-32 factor RpoH [Candidatus Deianiraea vastatrix]